MIGGNYDYSRRCKSISKSQTLQKKVKEYEQRIEKEIIDAATNNHLHVILILKDDYPLLDKALDEVSQNFTNNGFEVIYTWVDYNKYAIGVNW